MPNTRSAKIRVIAIVLALVTCIGWRELHAQPIRVVVARLTHDHVGRVWSVKHPDVQIVGVYEPNTSLVDRLAEKYGFDRRMVYSDMKKMLDAVKPDAVVAFGSIYEHLEVVEAAAQ